MQLYYCFILLCHRLSIKMLYISTFVGGKSKDVEIDEEGDASKHSETAFKAMEYGKPTFMVNKKCSFIVSVKKKYEYRLHDMTEHDLEKLNICNIRFIQIE